MTAVLASNVIVRTSTGEAVMFWVGTSALALLGAGGVVLAVNAVYSAFLATMIILAIVLHGPRTRCFGCRPGGCLHRRGDDMFLFVLMLRTVWTPRNH